MKKLLITGAFGEAATRMAEYSFPSFVHYAEKHGYDYKFIERYNDQHPAWQKVYALQEYLKTYDIVLWLDIDCFIVNPEKDIAEVFDFAKGFQAIPCEPDEPNTGVWVMRKDELANDFLEYLIELSDVCQEPCYEQDAVKSILDQSYKHLRRTIFLEEKFNNIHGHVPDSEEIIKHFAGRTDLEKIEELRELAGTGENVFEYRERK